MTLGQLLDNLEKLKKLREIPNLRKTNEEIEDHDRLEGILIKLEEYDT